MRRKSSVIDSFLLEHFHKTIFSISRNQSVENNSWQRKRSVVFIHQIIDPEACAVTECKYSNLFSFFCTISFFTTKSSMTNIIVIVQNPALPNVMNQQLNFAIYLHFNVLQYYRIIVDSTARPRLLSDVSFQVQFRVWSISKTSSASAVIV